MDEHNSVKVFLMAQGEAKRWGARRHIIDRFMSEAPPYKQLLEINGEKSIIRSVRLFLEAGADPTVIAGQDLLFLSGLQSYGYTMHDPGSDIMRGVSDLINLYQPRTRVIIALGDVIFSRKAITDLVHSCKTKEMGCMARVEPSRVCSKVADEVFAIWFTPNLWYSEVHVRMETMLKRGGFRPHKPWAFPFSVTPSLERIIHAYNLGDGLKTIKDELLVTEDYTDDVDSPEEWVEFWDDIRAAAEADV